jgi:hypothetical protein
MSVLVGVSPIAFAVVVVLIVTVKTISWVSQTDSGGSKQAEEEYPSNPGVLVEETGNLRAAPFPPSSDRGEQFRNEESSRTSQDKDDSSTSTNIEWDELEFDWTKESEVTMADVGGMEELKTRTEAGHYQTAYDGQGEGRIARHTASEHDSIWSSRYRQDVSDSRTDYRNRTPVCEAKW